MHQDSLQGWVHHSNLLRLTLTSNMRSNEFGVWVQQHIARMEAITSLPTHLSLHHSNQYRIIIISPGPFFMGICKVLSLQVYWLRFQTLSRTTATNTFSVFFFPSIQIWAHAHTPCSDIHNASTAPSSPIEHARHCQSYALTGPNLSLAARGVPPIYIYRLDPYLLCK